MPRIGTITLYFDPEAYKAEMIGDDDPNPRLTKADLERIGQEINDEVASYYGYSGWNTKFINVKENS
jgi:hypothetical protein